MYIQDNFLYLAFIILSYSTTLNKLRESRLIEKKIPSDLEDRGLHREIKELAGDANGGVGEIKSLAGQASFTTHNIHCSVDKLSVQANHQLNRSSVSRANRFG